MSNEQTEFENPETERRSDVDGFTIVARKGRRPKIHLLRPWNECNTERGKSGADTVRVAGGREQLAAKLSELGFKHGGVACKRCFRYVAEEDVETPALELGYTEIHSTLDKYDEEIRAAPTVLVEL